MSKYESIVIRCLINYHLTNYRTPRSTGLLEKCGKLHRQSSVSLPARELEDFKILCSDDVITCVYSQPYDPSTHHQTLYIKNAC
jgi:hypothetical protein